MTRSLLTVALTLVCNTALAADGCKKPETQLAMNECAQHEYTKVNADLNQVYRDVLSNMQGAKRRSEFVKVEQAWIKFRDMQCKFEASAYQGGSLMPLIQSSCLTSLSQQRIKDLRAMSDNAEK